MIMEQVAPERVWGQFRDGVSVSTPIYGRTYTLTHSDESGELFNVTGTQVAKDKIGDFRDEVVLEFAMRDGRPVLMGTVLIDGEGVKGNSKLRNDIFMREMPTALQAIRLADAFLYQRFPELDEVPIEIEFLSGSSSYHRVEKFGSMREYRRENEKHNQMRRN